MTNEAKREAMHQWAAAPASEPQALSEERIEALAHRFYDAARPDCAVPYGVAERLAKIALATETQKGNGE